MSQEELAIMLGVSKGAVSRWESRRRTPGASSVRLISQTTGIPIAALRPDLAELMA